MWNIKCRGAHGLSSCKLGTLVLLNEKPPRFKGEALSGGSRSPLDVKERAKILSILTILEENGYELREPYSKYLGSNIFELRIKTYKNAVRVLYFFYQDKKIVLTNAFSKKTNKTPKKEIELAKKRKSEYEKRSSE